MSLENHNDSPVFFERLAREDFDTALRKGFWRSVFSWINKSSNQLLPFDEIRRVLPVQNQYDAGVQQILIDKVVGSVGRYNDFDRAFLPRQKRTRDRWMNVDIANRREVTLPPIEVYKVGDVYFVKDGNHRVSVARERGQKYIDANVIEIVTNIAIDEHTNIDEIILKQEKFDFYKTTQLESLRPGVEIELTLPGQYEKLLEHINVHRWYMGVEANHEIPYEEAVDAWYDRVYSPLVQVIQEQNIINDFPGRTVADLYLWIIEHLYYLREEFQSEVSLVDAAQHFTEEFSKNPIRRLFTLFHKLAGVVAEGLEDASGFDLGLLPEEMMINAEPPPDDEDE